MTDIDRLYLKIKAQWQRRRQQIDATAEELKFLVELLDTMEADDFAKDTNVACKWASVKDRLPEKSGEYFVHTLRGKLENLNYSVRHKAFNAFDGLIDDRNKIEVTHWMPLPEPPKEDKQNG